MSEPRFASLARRVVFVTITIPANAGNASLLSDLLVAGTVVAPVGQSVTLSADQILSALVEPSSTQGILFGGKGDATPFEVTLGSTLSEQRIPAAYWPFRTWVKASTVGAGTAFSANAMVFLK